MSYSIVKPAVPAGLCVLTGFHPDRDGATLLGVGLLEGGEDLQKLALRRLTVLFADRHRLDWVSLQDAWGVRVKERARTSYCDQRIRLEGRGGGRPSTSSRSMLLQGGKVTEWGGPDSDVTRASAQDEDPLLPLNRATSALTSRGSTPRQIFELPLGRARLDARDGNGAPAGLERVTKR